MSSIYDLNKPAPAPVKEKAAKRSKHRETLTPSQLRDGQIRLNEMAEQAFATLEAATIEADWPTAVKAACAVLDRAGFGPKSTVDVNTTHVDLSNLSKEELADRALKVSEMIRAGRAGKAAIVEPPAPAGPVTIQ